MIFILGNSLSAILEGEARLTFLNRGEDYVMTMPYAHCKGKWFPYLSYILYKPFLSKVYGCNLLCFVIDQNVLGL